MTDTANHVYTAIERTAQRVVFAVGIGNSPLCVFSVTSGDEHDAGDELAFYGFDILADAIEESLEDGISPGIYVWEGTLRSAGDSVKVPGSEPRPLMHWHGTVRLALPEEILEVNGDYVPSPAASAGNAA